MPRNTNMNQMQKDSAAAHGRLTAALPRFGRKAPGTRAGTYQDWRGSNKSGKASVGIGKSIRDGR
jgi:hypothetical protein